MENDVTMPNVATEKVAVTTNEGPVKKFKCGAVIATIWANKYKNKEGIDDVIHSVTISRVYKKEGDDEWKDTNSFNTNDLPKVKLVTDAAYQYLALVDVSLEKKE